LFLTTFPHFNRQTRAMPCHSFVNFADSFVFVDTGIRDHVFVCEANRQIIVGHRMNQPPD